MRNTIVATLVAIFLISGTQGCKTAPKLAFWKSGDKADVESTALAHSAPALPADVAKQAEAFASASPSIDISTPSIETAGAQAPPFTPAPAYVPQAASAPAANVAATSAPPFGSGTKQAPVAYPSTGASSYASTSPPATPPATSAMPKANVPPSVAAATPPALYNSDRSADLGSLSMPYNPNAVPPARTVASAATPTAESTTTDRYGSSTVASAYPTTGVPAASSAPVAPVTKATLPQFNGGSRYANVPAKTAPSTPPNDVSVPSTDSIASTSSVPAPSSAPPASSVPVTASTPANFTGDRYASTSPTIDASITPTTTVPLVSTAPSVSTAPQVASTTPYRPGGTSSYEGLSAGPASVEIATRPEPPQATVPNLTAPPSASEQTTAPRYR